VALIYTPDANAVAIVDDVTDCYFNIQFYGGVNCPNLIRISDEGGEVGEVYQNLISQDFPRGVSSLINIRTRDTSNPATSLSSAIFPESLHGA